MRIMWSMVLSLIRVCLLTILCIVQMIMSVERKNPLKRDQALNDATSGQIGEEPRSVPEQTSGLKNERMRTARKISRDM
jgi:hypothetical protein